MREIKKQRSSLWDEELYEELFRDYEEGPPMRRVSRGPRSAAHSSARDRASRRARKRHRQQDWLFR